MNNDIFVQLIRYLIEIKKEDLKNREQCYLLIQDSKGFFENILTPQFLNFQEKRFIIRKINYYNQIEIDNKEIFEEIIDEDYLILLYKMGKKTLEQKFLGFEITHIEFSIFYIISSMFEFELDRFSLDYIEKYKENFLNIEIFNDLCKSVKYFNRNIEKLQTIKNLKLNNLFNLLFSNS